MNLQMIEYSQAHGPVVSPNQKLNLLLNHSDFQWFRPLSTLISVIDGLVFQKEPLTPKQISEAEDQIRALFFSSELSEFQKHYKAALLDHPETVLLHQKLKSIMELQ